MTVKFQDVKVGDRIWISDGWRTSKARLATVARITPTQIVVDHDRRYYRENGYRVGGFSGCGHATGFARPAEIEAWEKKIAKQREEDDRQEIERKRIEILRGKLNELFAENAYVNESNGYFQVVFGGLTEDQVRELAKKVEGRD